MVPKELWRIVTAPNCDCDVVRSIHVNYCKRAKYGYSIFYNVIIVGQYHSEYFMSLILDYMPFEHILTTSYYANEVRFGLVDEDRSSL